MKRFFLLTAAMMVLVMTALFSSCKYKDLCYDHDHQKDNNILLQLELILDLDVDLDVSEAAHTKILVPTYMVVCFYDTLSGSLRDVEYVGPYGGSLHVAPGTYDMVVYTFDTEWTQVRGETQRSTLEAFTSDITAMKTPVFSLCREADTTAAPGPIIYTPDHLLVARKRVEIPEFTYEGQVIVIQATASTAVETYGFEVPNVTGIEYVSSVDAFVTNQAVSTFFGRGEVNAEPATIYFPLDVNRTDTCFKSTFNTFGKLPGESKSYLNIVLFDTKGKPFVVVTDITEQFNDPGHKIIIPDTIVIPAPEGGGIAPTVEEWEEINHDVPIG